MFTRMWEGKEKPKGVRILDDCFDEQGFYTMLVVDGRACFVTTPYEVQSTGILFFFQFGPWCFDLYPIPWKSFEFECEGKSRAQQHAEIIERIKREGAFWEKQNGGEE